MFEKDVQYMRNNWEKEYQNPKLVTLDTEPQASVKKFLRWLKKELKNVSENTATLTGSDTLAQLRVLDLGCGTGRNALYLAELGARAVGIDISKTAITHARERASKLEVTEQTEFFVGSIGEPLKFPDQSFDLIFDVTASNALAELERTIYMSEMKRLLAPGGYIFVRALCKDGDDNAKELIRTSPGPEKDTYIMPGTGFIERVFSREDFVQLYSQYFNILKLDKETHYTSFEGRKYKRNFWVAYLS